MTSQEHAARLDAFAPRDPRLDPPETPVQAIRDFLKAVDRGYLGAMPEGFNDSMFVKALRDQIK